MQRAGSHLARVVEADGRTVGVLFLEDVLEELVGEVSDATQRGRQEAGGRPAQRSLDGALTPPQRRL
jgi:CBS domain containing-hemolysin-like protein